MEWLLKRSWVAGGYASRERESEAWEQALEMVRHYHLAFKDEPVKHLGSEAYLKARLSVRSIPVALSGKIDRLSTWPDGRLEVVDYKTGDEAEPGPTKLAGKLTTFLYYVLALLNHPEVPRVEVSYIYLRTMAKVTAVYDPETGADCKDRLARAVGQMAAGEYPAHPNQRCAWCDFTELCTLETPAEVDLAGVL
jgi:RecB family exonuclease